MAFVRLAYFPGGTEEQYREIARRLDAAPVPPERLLFMAGAVAGGWQVVQVWDDKAGLEAFNERWLLPAMKDLGGRGFPAPPVVTDFDAIELWLREG